MTQSGVLSADPNKQLLEQRKARGPKSDKFWADAVRRAAMERTDRIDSQGKPVTDAKGKALRMRRINQLAINLFDRAIEGDMQAAKEIGLRLDGLPKGVEEALASIPVNINITMGDGGELRPTLEQEPEPVSDAITFNGNGANGHDAKPE